MPRRHRADVTIDASPTAVWDILVDTARWPEWDPTCERIDGTPAKGAKVTAYTKLAPGRGFGVKVRDFEAPSLMTWTGGSPLGIMFSGVRTFTLTPTGDQTHFAIQEVFSGLMLPLISKSIPNLDEPFRQFCDGLKQRAETA